MQRGHGICHCGDADSSEISLKNETTTLKWKHVHTKKNTCHNPTCNCLWLKCSAGSGLQHIYPWMWLSVQFVRLKLQSEKKSPEVTCD